MMPSAVGWDTAPEVAAWPGLPPLEGNAAADACVVGLGGSGLAAVEAFADAGLAVIGVDAGRVGAGAAGRNGGFLLGGGAPAFHEAVGRWGEDVAVALYRATLAELDRLSDRLGPEVLRRAGSIRLAGLPGGDEDRSAEAADCARQEEAMRAAGLAVERYAGPLGEGLFFPDDAQVNPALRVVRTAERLAGRARLHEGTTVRAVRARSVVTDAGEVSARLVVVAVDGGLELLLPQLADLVRTARLQMLSTAPLPTGRLPCPVYARWGYDYAQQDAAGRLYVGAGRDRFVDAEWTTNTQPTESVQRYADEVAARMAGQPVDVEARWAASVGFTEDGRALCLPMDDGVVACGGYSGIGNLVGPVAVRAAVAWLVDGIRPPRYFRSDAP
jgi:glycine/D-amino acid oxidase-like deaminating enzyme